MAKAKPLIPLVRSGYYPSNGWTPLVLGNGSTTQDGGGGDDSTSDVVDVGMVDYMILRS